MDGQALARAVATEEGSNVLAEVDRELGDGVPPRDQARTFGLTETITIGSFLVSCAQLAIQVWQARQDRALLLLDLVEATQHDSSHSAGLDSEKRLDLVGKLVNRLVPENRTSSPSIPARGNTTKADWLKDWLGFGTRAWTPTVLMPFADMDNFIVYRPITWTPPASATSDLPRVVTIPRGFVTDLATIPEYFWWALPPSGRYGHAAILHDWLYWDQSSSREIADRVFDVAMDELQVAMPLRKAMWAAVRVYGGKHWLRADAERQNGGSRILKKFPESPTVTWADWRTQPAVFA
jgi:uncharacterized protein DUF1353